MSVAPRLRLPLRLSLFALVCGALMGVAAPHPARAQLSGTLSGPTFVQTAGIAGLFEIESSKIALKRSENPEIRAFAESMVADHTKIAAALKRAVEDAKGDLVIPAAADAEHADMLKKLEAAPAREFDALYIQMQTLAHEQAVGLFGAFAKDGDQAALKTFAADTLPTLQAHLAHVQRLSAKT